MILTCPQCETQFELDASLLLPDGKRVRCSACTHEWLQKPEGADEGEQSESVQPEDAQPDEGNTTQQADIPEGVKPTHDDSPKENKANEKQSVIDHLKDQENLMGYGAALLVFMVILILLTVFSGGLAKAWPAMKGLYNVIGVQVHSAGQGLSFDRVSASYTRDQKVKIVGDVLNLTSHHVDVPQMTASMVVDGQALPVQWAVDAKAKTIEAESKTRFTSEYHYEGESRPKSVTISFDLSGQKTKASVPVEESHDHHDGHH